MSCILPFASSTPWYSLINQHGACAAASSPAFLSFRGSPLHHHHYSTRNHRLPTPPSRSVPQEVPQRSGNPVVNFPSRFPGGTGRGSGGRPEGSWRGGEGLRQGLPRAERGATVRGLRQTSDMALHGNQGLGGHSGSREHCDLRSLPHVASRGGLVNCPQSLRSSYQHHFHFTDERAYNSPGLKKSTQLVTVHCFTETADKPKSCF